MAGVFEDVPVTTPENGRHSLVELAFIRALLLAQQREIGAICDKLDIKPERATSQPPRPFLPQDDETLEEIERRLIRRRLRLFRGNRTRTAQSLGLTVRTIRNWINRWDIDIPVERNPRTFEARLRRLYSHEPIRPSVGKGWRRTEGG